MKESEAEALRARWATRAAHGGQEREVDSQVPIGEPGTIGRLRVPRTFHSSQLAGPDEIFLPSMATARHRGDTMPKLGATPSHAGEKCVFKTIDE